MATSLQVKALFDFESGGPGELSFSANEILSVVQQDVGDGWWEACNSRGESGLIPMSYVEVVRSPPPSANPRPLPGANRPSVSNNHAPPLRSSNVINTANNNDANDWTDEEWDDDDEAEQRCAPLPQSRSIDDNSYSGHQVVRTRSLQGISSHQSGTGTLRGRFSRSGTDAFLFEESPVLPETDKNVFIVDSGVGPVWQCTTGSTYSCAIGEPKLEKKFHGMKSFIAYKLTPTFSNIQVSRRYKQFDWLQQRLAEKFPVIAVPPLPGKQISGRFEDDFVNERLKGLQLWIDRMCKHPIVAHSSVFLHFLSCTDDKRWTAGKRKAEKDELVGDRWFFCVQTSPTTLDNKRTDTQVQNFNRFVKSMDDSIRHLAYIGECSVKKHEESFSKHYRKIGNAFGGLSKSFELDDRPGSKDLTAAIEHTSQTYEEIGGLWARQPKHDMINLLDGLQEYKGLLSRLPDIVMIHKSASAKVVEKEIQGKLSESELQEVKGRSDVITYCVLAEAQHFHQNRITDFREYMRHYLTAQIEFHKMLAAKLEETLKQYDRVM